MKENIIVIGASGNLGMYFLDYLLENIDSEMFNVIATGTSGKYKYSFYNGDYVQLDITNKDSFENLPKSNVKAVIDFAGVLPAYKKDETNQRYVDVNVSGTLNILEYCKNVSADRIVYMHTWADLNGYLRLDEPLKPYAERKPILTGDHAVYCATKCCAVDLIKCYQAMYKIKGFVFRLPNIYLYSPNKYYYVDGQKVLVSYRYMIDKAINGDNLEVWGDPTFGKDIIYVKDLCQMIYKSVFADVNGGIYNAGTGVKTTMLEQVEGIIKVFSNGDKKSEIVFCPQKRNCDNFVMDITNIKEDLGYEPQYDYISYLEDYKKEMELNRFVERDE